MSKRRLTTFDQHSAFDSPYSYRYRLGILLWDVVYTLFFRPTPKFFRPWRVFLLRLFGARIRGTVFVSESARIKVPWNLTMHHRACIGPHCDIYNLAKITIKKRATVSRHVALCGGEHDITTRKLPLVVGEIIIGEDVFIGSHAFVSAGVRLEDGVVVGSASVVTGDLPAWKICVGNPCRAIKDRVLKDSV